MSAALDRLRARIDALPSRRLVDVVTRLEAAPRGDADRLVYSVACATLCRRLGLDAQAIARSSVVGPAEALRLALELQN